MGVLSVVGLVAGLVGVADDAGPVQPELDAGCTVALAATWEPCRESTYGLFERTAVLREVTPARERQEYRGQVFEGFLPGEAVTVGTPYPVKEEVILPLLRQFHPGVSLSVLSRGFEAPGTRALLRGVGDEHYEILLRSHVGFQLSPGVIYKPAQFEGRLVVERATGRVEWFRLHLPSRNTNVDVNVRSTGTDADPAEPGTYGADIGWVPRMELVSGPEPRLVLSRSISLDEGRDRLRRAFYPSASLDWMPFEAAVAECVELGLPLHVIVLFGTFDDESC